jgi:GNAT superfamily N-acetyltransferase
MDAKHLAFREKLVLLTGGRAKTEVVIEILQHPCRLLFRTSRKSSGASVRRTLHRLQRCSTWWQGAQNISTCAPFREAPAPSVCAKIDGTDAACVSRGLPVVVVFNTHFLRCCRGAFAKSKTFVRSLAGRTDGRVEGCEEDEMMMSDDIRHYSADAILGDGTPICIRAIRPDDKEKLAGHFDGLSSESHYRRFFGFRNISADELSCFSEPDFLSHVALVATIDQGEGLQSIVGDGRYVVGLKRPDAAELALSVLDAYQRRGIGTFLLEHLLKVGRRAGIRQLEAEVLASNPRALRFLIRRGFRPSGTSGGVCQLALSTEDRGTGSIARGQPTSGTVRQRAYQLYLARGRKPGGDLEDWLKAERELRGF